MENRHADRGRVGSFAVRVAGSAVGLEGPGLPGPHCRGKVPRIPGSGLSGSYRIKTTSFHVLGE